MNWKIAMAIAALSLPIACATSVSQNSSAIFNNDLAAAYSNLEASLAEQRSPLSFASNGEASDCNSYLDLSRKSRVAEGVHNQLVKREYLICDALHILPASPKAAVTAQPGADVGQQLLA